MFLFLKKPINRSQLRSVGRQLLLTLLACALTTIIAWPLYAHHNLATIVMLYLLTVLIVAVGLGAASSLLAAFLSVGMLAYFFVSPRFSFQVYDDQSLVTLAVMLVVAIITGQLAGGLSHQADEAESEAKRSRALYEMARDLTGALTVEQIVKIARKFLCRVFNADVSILLPDEAGVLQVCVEHEVSCFLIEPRLARMVFEHGAPIECPQQPGSGYPAMYLPLNAAARVLGVLAVALPDGQVRHFQGQGERLAAMASLVAIAIERVYYADVARQTQVQVASERLRSSILSAVSHDLRTPLTVLVGLADSLNATQLPLGADAQAMAREISGQAGRLAGMVDNLLDMARLHAGEVSLHKEWLPIEEVIGSSIKLLGHALAQHSVKVNLAKGLPLVEFDAVLIERVLCNVLENAAKYSPPATLIEIEGQTREGVLEVKVSDCGQGFASDHTGKLFDMFVRGEVESSKPGVGLGLAICRAVVEAHAGSISASNRAEGGACVVFTLPLGDPPQIEEEHLFLGGAEQV